MNQFFQQLQTDSKRYQSTHLRDLFNADNERWQTYSDSCGSLWVNYSRNLIDNQTFALFYQLIESRGLAEKIEALFTGEVINQSESRKAMHPLLRAPLDNSNPYSVAVHAELAKMAKLCEQLADGSLFKTPITDVVCIGIGGSELGAKTVHQAFSASLTPKFNLHFVANIDGQAAKLVMDNVDKKSCIFLVTSKTFTTFETTTNYHTLKDWFCASHSEDEFQRRCFAITANRKKALESGFIESQIFEFWDWVGGRFSVWSSVGLPIALAYGMDVFKDLLAGANLIDEHFRKQPFKANLPVLLAILHTWYVSFLKYPTRAVIPYAQKLSKLPSYLMQLEMESLGKTTNIEGQTVDYPTSPIVWGSAGSNGQHAFFQLLHQGSQIVPVDFIAALEPEHGLIAHHNALLSNCLAQSESLMTGGEIDNSELHGRFHGNRPSTLILMQRIDAQNIGQLLALYEHKVFVQSVMWNVNAFDQWGVELGKKIANEKLAETLPDEPIGFTTIKNSFNTN